MVSIRNCGVGGGVEAAKELAVDSGELGGLWVGETLGEPLEQLLGEKLKCLLRFCFECLVEVGFFCVMRFLSVGVIIRSNF